METPIPIVIRIKTRGGGGGGGGGAQLVIMVLYNQHLKCEHIQLLEKLKYQKETLNLQNVYLLDNL